MTKTTSLLPPPPVSLLDGASLFLDFDGTLVPLTDDPAAVAPPASVIALLETLRDRLDGRLAIVSGRSIEVLRAFGLGNLVLCGSHGLEVARADGGIDRPASVAALEEVARAFDAFAAGRPGILVERKTLGIGLHYRNAPVLEPEALAIAEAQAAAHGLYVQHGKMLFEVRPGGADKGTGVRHLMARAPFDRGRPVMIGDDVTDEDGFAVVCAQGGAAVLVGPERETHARYRFEDVPHVLAWLDEAVQGADR